MPDPLFDWTLVSTAAIVILFPVLVYVGVRTLRRVIVRRNPELDAQ